MTDPVTSMQRLTARRCIVRVMSRSIRILAKVTLAAALVWAPACDEGGDKKTDDKTAEKADGAIFTTYYNPRESSPDDLLRMYEKFGGKQGSTEEHPEAALEEAIEQAGPDGLVLVTGSVYLAGLLRQAAVEYADGSQQ